MEKEKFTKIFRKQYSTSTKKKKESTFKNNSKLKEKGISKKEDKSKQVTVRKNVKVVDKNRGSRNHLSCKHTGKELVLSYTFPGLPGLDSQVREYKEYKEFLSIRELKELCAKMPLKSEYSRIRGIFAFLVLFFTGIKISILLLLCVKHYEQIIEEKKLTIREGELECIRKRFQEKSCAELDDLKEVALDTQLQHSSAAKIREKEGNSCVLTQGNFCVLAQGEQENEKNVAHEKDLVYKYKKKQFIRERVQTSQVDIDLDPEGVQIFNERSLSLDFYRLVKDKKGNEPIFTKENIKGIPLTREFFNSHLNQICNQVFYIKREEGTKKRVTTHTFRQAFTHRLLRNRSLSLEEIRKKIGHNDIKTTWLYQQRML